MGRRDDASLHTPKCNYAAIHDVQCMNGVGSLEKAPRDGACLWHARTAAGTEEGAWSPNASFILKNDILDFLRSRPNKLASLLNASCSAAEAILHDWGPQDVWADGRAPPLIAAPTGATVMVVNMAEQCLEVFTCATTLDTLTNCGCFVTTMSTDCVRVHDQVRVHSYKHALLSHFSSMSLR